MNHHIHNPRSRAAGGFTLTEMMISLTLVSLLSVGLMTFMLDVARGIFWGTEKASISEDVRSFTMRLAKEARSANTGVIYPSFATSDRDTASDQRKQKQSGDCLVLVNTEPYPDADDPEFYTGMVIYFRRAEGENGIGPVYRTEWAPDDPADYLSSVDYTLEEVLSKIAVDDSGNYPIVVELSRGISNGRLFRNYQNRTIVVNGEILHGNEVKEITNTYNLSISPRG